MLQNFQSEAPLSTTSPMTTEDIVRVEAMLLRGDRETALNFALDKQDWALAMMLASVCGADKYQEVVRRFQQARFSPTGILPLLSMVYSNQAQKLLQSTNTPIAVNSSAKVTFHQMGAPVSSLPVTASTAVTQNWRVKLSALLANKTPEWESNLNLLGFKMQCDES
ncbi:hypothetical protein M1146_05225, partial [Patescibacteria group bacterium]|nr:hypothetical protein [Patescibacteria group bacterium]